MDFSATSALQSAFSTFFSLSSLEDHFAVSLLHSLTDAALHSLALLGLQRHLAVCLFAARCSGSAIHSPLVLSPVLAALPPSRSNAANLT